MSHAPDAERVERVAAALLDPVLEPIVDMVATVAADGAGYDVRTVDGRVRFRPAGGNGDGFVETLVEGRNPLGDTATDLFVPLADERANPWPTRTSQSYPHAHESIAQVFDHPAAPDIVCLHTPAHNWEDQGGERGEHGSLGIVQVRAPFVLSARACGGRGRCCRSRAGWSTSPPPSSPCSARARRSPARTGGC